MRIRIKLITLMRMRIRILSFNLMLIHPDPQHCAKVFKIILYKRIYLRPGRGPNRASTLASCQLDIKRATTACSPPSESSEHPMTGRTAPRSLPRTWCASRHRHPQGRCRHSRLCRTRRRSCCRWAGRTPCRRERCWRMLYSSLGNFGPET